MKSQITARQSVVGAILVTVLLLMLPLVAMQFTREVNWSLSDFVIMGAIIFASILAFITAVRLVPNGTLRAAYGLAIGSTFFMVWANLAVGLVGSGANLANLLFMVSVLIALFGSLLSGFTAQGMALSMYGTAFSIVLVGVISFISGLQNKVGSGVEVIGVTILFATLYAASGLLFRLASRSMKRGAP